MYVAALVLSAWLAHSNVTHACCVVAVFSNMLSVSVSSEYLNALATADAFSVVKQVQEFFGDYYAVNPDLFTLCTANRCSTCVLALSVICLFGVLLITTIALVVQLALVAAGCDVGCFRRRCVRTLRARRAVLLAFVKIKAVHQVPGSVRVCPGASPVLLPL